MSASAHPATSPDAPRGRGGGTPQSSLPLTGLLRAELRRLLLRRMVVGLVLVYLGMLGVAMTLAFLSYNKPDTARMAEAYTRALAQCEQRNAAAPRPEPPPGFLETTCTDRYGASVEEFARFHGGALLYEAAQMIPAGVAVTAGTFAGVAFLIGATAIGADWAAKTLPGLLTWEPRRIRLLLVKLLALLLLVTPCAAMMQAAHLGAATLITESRGTWAELPPDFWADLWPIMARGIALAAMFAAAGFALAARFRYTAAAVGFAFGYLVVFEMALSFSGTWWEQWKLSPNVAGWLAKGAIELRYEVNRPVFDDNVDSFAPYYGTREIVVYLTNARSLTYLLVGLGAALLVALLSFRWRDAG